MTLLAMAKYFSEQAKAWVRINVSNNTGVSLNPQIATSGNNVYVTWQDGTPGNYDIFFAASTNNGTSFWYTNKPKQQYWRF